MPAIAERLGRTIAEPRYKKIGPMNLVEGSSILPAPACREYRRDNRAYRATPRERPPTVRRRPLGCAAVADRNAVGFRPRPDLAAALASGRSSRRPAALSSCSLARMLDEGCEPLTEFPRILVPDIALVPPPPPPDPPPL